MTKIKYFSAVVLFTLANTVLAQIKTSEVQVEETGNITSITGELGIGTSSPQAPLHIKANTEDDILGYFEQSASSSNNAGIAIKGAKNNSTSTVSFINLDIYDNDEANKTFTLAKIGAAKQTNAGENGQLRFYTNSGSSLGERMVIDHLGMVGIGVQNPGAHIHLKVNDENQQDEIKLGDFAAIDPLARSGHYPALYAEEVLRVPQRVQIFGGGAGKQYLDIRDQSGEQIIKLDGEGHSFFKNNYIGIGTTNPEAPLHIKKNPENMGDADIMAYFEQSASTSENAGIKIKGAKNNSTSTVSFIDFDIYDSNESQTDFTMAKVGAGKEAQGINGQLRFYTHNGTSLDQRMTIKANGNVGIGTTNPGYPLEVNGEIHASTFSPWPDFVFEDNYALPSLESIERHIQQYGHLQDIPSASEVKENGVSLVEMNAKLLQKIEELTLHLIAQQKEMQAMQQEIKELKKLSK